MMKKKKENPMNGEKESVRQQEQQDPQGVDRQRNLDFEVHKKKTAKAP